MAIKDEDLAKALVEKGLMDKKKVDALLARAQSQKESLESILLEKQSLTSEVMGTLFAELYEVPFVDLSGQTIKEAVLSIVPKKMAAAQLLIPFEQATGVLRVAMANPDNFEILSFLENKTGMIVEPYYAIPQDLQLALKAYSRDVNEKFNELLQGAMSDPTKIESLKDASKIVDTIILFAHQSEASDIHIEPHKDFVVVRYRVDGILHTIAELPIAIHELVVTRIKVLSNMRTDEHRAAQDGRFKIDLENNEITLRVSVLPTYDGEKVVMRLLSSSHQDLDLEALGYTKENLEKIRNNIHKSHGLILMTGPTGSGKTTTLYSLLKLVNSPEVNISTIEDPIEYRLDGINQTQVNVKTELTFANGLRSLVRQDPDVIMVGEIRDEETSGVAINAALTGHLVLATLHTNSAAATLPRMIEMGVESFLLAATIQVVIAQRLVRKICNHCKVSYEMSIAQLSDFAAQFDLKENLVEILQHIGSEDKATIFTFYKGEGCEVCGGSGFKGRTCIAEVMEISDTIQDNILSSVPESQIEELAVKEGMHTMFVDGLMKVVDGDTTIEEVLRVMRN
jgi:type IV pilus assembly protein PilB